MIYPLTSPSLKGSSSAVQLPSLYVSKTAKQSRLHQHKLLGCASFEDNLVEKFPIIKVEQYNKWSAQQINIQYQDMKQELRRIGDKLNALIENKQAGTKAKKDSKLEKTKSPSVSHLSALHQSTMMSPSNNEVINNHDDLYEGYEKNNTKMFSNNKHELKKLLEREKFILHSNNPHGLKEELKQKIQKIKEDIKQQKKNYKQLMFQSQKIGNDIINTDKLIEQIRILEKELNILVLRKRKLLKQIQQNSKNQQIITQGSVEIAPKQPQLNQYENKKKHSQQKAKTQQQMKSIMSKKLRTIAAMKRDKQARDKIQNKRYYQILRELNEIQQRSQTYPNKMTILQTKIQLSQHDYEEFKIQFDQLMTKKKFQRQNLKNNERSSFLTEVLNLQQNQDIRKSTFYQTKQNLQQHKTTQKDMMKEISENLLKTQRNINELQKKLTPRNSQAPIEIDAIVDQTQKNQHQSQSQENSSTSSSKKGAKGNAKRDSAFKRFQKLEDSEIIQQPQQFENSHQIEQLEQRFKEKDNGGWKKGPFEKLRM